MFSASGEEIPDDRGDVEGNKNDKGKILHEYPCTSHKANMCHRRATATGPCLVCHSCVQDLRLKSEIERERGRFLSFPIRHLLLVAISAEASHRIPTQFLEGMPKVERGRL